MRVLVADDDLSSLLTLETFLEDLGYDVATANNGREAFELIQKGDYRLVISDWEMPYLNGLDLCRMVRQRQLGLVQDVRMMSAEPASTASVPAACNSRTISLNCRT